MFLCIAYICDRFCLRKCCIWEWGKATFWAKKTCPHFSHFYFLFMPIFSGLCPLKRTISPLPAVTDFQSNYHSMWDNHKDKDKANGKIDCLSNGAKSIMFTFKCVSAHVNFALAWKIGLGMDEVRTPLGQHGSTGTRQLLGWGLSDYRQETHGLNIARIVKATSHKSPEKSV